MCKQTCEVSRNLRDCPEMRLWRSRKFSATTPPPPNEPGPLMEITENLITKDAKERADATGLRKTWRFRRVDYIVVWERILTLLYRASHKQQASNTDIYVSVRLLSAAQGDLKQLRASWDDLLLTANASS